MKRYPSLPTRRLNSQLWTSIPPQPLESARISFREHIANSANEVAHLEWILSEDKPLYALEISDQNNIPIGLNINWRQPTRLFGLNFLC